MGTPKRRGASELARDHTERAIDTIAEIMNDPFAENRDRLKAASEMLDRGHGKAAQAVIAIPPLRAAREEASRLTDEELDQIILSAPLPRLRHEQEPIEGEIIEDPLLA